MDIILQEAEKILSPHLEAVSAKNAGRIWGFILKFVVLDRFSEVFGAAEIHPGLPVPRKTSLPDYLGTGEKVTYFSQSPHTTFLTCLSDSRRA